MASARPIPMLGGVRFGPWTRLAALVIAVLALLGATSDAGAVGGERRIADPVAFARSESVDDAARRQARRDPATKTGGLPAKHAQTEEQTESFADRGLGRGREFLDRYGSEKIVLAVVVGALVQLLCLVLVRLVGTMLRFVSRGLAWSVGVGVALYLLGGSASLPASAGEAVGWLRRLAGLVDLVA